MTVSRAVPDDVPRLVQLARQEHLFSRFAGQPFDEARTAMAFRQAIDDHSKVVFISREGFIAGMVQPMLFNRYWNAYELAWFAADGQGLRLLKALAHWARGMRALELVVHNYAGIVAPEQFTRVMARMGFAAVGVTYSKQIGEF